jgi:hypothetical protein
MSKFMVDVKLGNGHPKRASGPEIEEADQTSTNLAGQVATIGAVAVGVALISAELLPGVVIGVAAAMAPKHIPKLGKRMEPLFKSTVRGAYKLGRKARHAVGEFQERVNDITAEVKAQKEKANAAATAEQVRPPEPQSSSSLGSSGRA